MTTGAGVLGSAERPCTVGKITAMLNPYLLEVPYLALRKKLRPKVGWNDSFCYSCQVSRVACACFSLSLSLIESKPVILRKEPLDTSQVFFICPPPLSYLWPGYSDNRLPSAPCNFSANYPLLKPFSFSSTFAAV